MKVLQVMSFVFCECVPRLKPDIATHLSSRPQYRNRLGSDCSRRAPLNPKHTRFVMSYISCVSLFFPPLHAVSSYPDPAGIAASILCHILPLLRYENVYGSLVM